MFQASPYSLTAPSVGYGDVYAYGAAEKKGKASAKDKLTIEGVNRLDVAGLEKKAKSLRKGHVEGQGFYQGTRRAGEADRRREEVLGLEIQPAPAPAPVGDPARGRTALSGIVGLWTTGCEAELLLNTLSRHALDIDQYVQVCGTWPAAVRSVHPGTDEEARSCAGGLLGVASAFGLETPASWLKLEE